MKAIRVSTIGGPEVLELKEIEIPEPTRGTVRVQIKAAGVNYIDTYHRSGQYQLGLPFTPGVEAAGIVDAIGQGVDSVSIGDQVAYVMELGAYAEYAIVPAHRLVPIPDNVPFNEAAAIMLQGMTAHYLTHSTYPLEKGATALIHAAAGGVGLLLVQLAKMRGATVYGTTSTEEKAELARSYGADDIILYTKSDFEEEIRKLTDGQGVQVVYDSVGKTTFHKSLNCLQPRGYLILYGQSSGAVEPIDPQLLNQKGSLFLTRPSLRDYAADPSETTGRAADLFAWMSTGELQVRIDKLCPLAAADAAHRYLESRKTKGKILLLPNVDGDEIAPERTIIEENEVDEA